MALRRFLNTDQSLIELRASASVLDAVKKMAATNVGSALIVAKNGKLEGIFTERDLLIRVVNEGLDPQQTKLGDVMTKDVIVLSSSSTLDHAIHIMGKSHVRHLPVEDSDNKIVGVLSLRSLLHEKIDEVIQELNLLEEFDDDVPGG